MSGTTNPDQYKELLSFYRAGLEDGAVKPQQIVDWVDGIIAKDVEVDPFFADIALAGHDLTRLLQAFNQYLGEQRDPIGYRASLGYLYWRLEREDITPLEAHDRIRRYLYGAPLVNDDERIRLIGSEDA